MTKVKIKEILRRFPYVLQMIKEGKSEEKFYINKKTEIICVDGEVKAVVEIIDELLDNTNDVAIIVILKNLKEGNKDLYILSDVPMSRSKFYIVKLKLLNKIYNCCIYRGIVPYEEILKEDIG